MIFCDIILPVYNSLIHVKTCIQALLAATDSTHYHLYIINDASDFVTQHYLQQQAKYYNHISVHTHEENLGFVKSCNQGIALGRSAYIVLLNSDVIVTPGWLPRLVNCAESDARIATVNPLTNCAAQIDLPLLPGCNFYDMDWAFERYAARHYPDIVTCVGFCLLLRRHALTQVGVLDEIYGQGYCEESDLCMRLTTQGYRTVVADNVYVFHQGQGSFTQSLERYRHNRRIFDSRWREAYWQQFRAFRRAKPLKPVFERVKLPTRWTPKPALWHSYRQLLMLWRQRALLRLMFELLRTVKNVIQTRTPIPDPQLTARFTRPQRLRVTYLLPQLVVAGGVLSVIQLINELILAGIEARIATLFVDPDLKHIRLLTQPLVFKNAQQLIQKMPATDLVVATHWHTAAWAQALVDGKQATECIYYLQDFESWFFPETAVDMRQRVHATYGLIKNRIVTSQWLHDLLAQHHYQAEKICIGTDLSLFYPRPVPQKQPPVILAMARPGTPWRGFDTLVVALKLIHLALPTAEIVLFGDNHLARHHLPFKYRDEGIIFRQEDLAQLYAQADVFLDASDHQGFGRLALEAMACGCACVLTAVGGVMEYARGDENCLLIPPKQPQACSTAVLKILSTPALKQRLIAGGLDTVQQFSLAREVKETLTYLNRFKL